jgi:hypothetical protein
MRREYPMTWLPLESKMFLSVAYDADKRILYLRFTSGDVYRYLQASETLASISARFKRPTLFLMIF